VPMILYKTGGQRWIYTYMYYMAVIAVRSPLESLLALELIIRAYSKACFISCLEVCCKVASSATTLVSV
jgi:hypothetical protein